MKPDIPSGPHHVGSHTPEAALAEAFNAVRRLQVAAETTDRTAFVELAHVLRALAPYEKRKLGTGKASRWHQRICRDFGDTFSHGDGPYAVLFKCNRSHPYDENYAVFFNDVAEAKAFLDRSNEQSCVRCGPPSEEPFSLHQLVDLRTADETTDDDVRSHIKNIGEASAGNLEDWAKSISLSPEGLSRSLQRLVADKRIVCDRDSDSYRLPDEIRRVRVVYSPR
jgi:hypothetical protein